VQAKLIWTGTGCVPKSRVRRRECIGWIAAGWLFLAAPAPAQTGKPLPRYVGLAGCASSSCHGGAGLNQNQNLIWARKDFHHKALAILSTARSERIAAALELPGGAMNARCTVCHSPFRNLPPAQLLHPARRDEGVSCESCHGAAEPWLRSHTRPDYTHRQRVASGMKNLRDLYVRAATCVACHENLEPDLAGAGHPGMAFELDGMTQSQPPHWRDEGEWFGLQAWLTGQATALRERCWKLAQSPGEQALTRARALSWVLARTTSIPGFEPTIPELPARPAADALNRLQQAADSLARKSAKLAWTRAKASALRKALAGTEQDFQAPADRPLAAQKALALTHALTRLTAALADDAGRPERAAILAELSAAAQAVPFDPETFRNRLAAFASSVE
jgi:hypothetical protein